MRTWSKLVLLFVLLVIVKTLLVSFVLAPSSPSDDYAYAKMALSFFNDGTFSVHGVPTNQYPPLYPIMLSLSYLVDDMRITFFLMKFINVILSSLIIFPAFFLAKEFFDDKKSLVIALVVSVLPMSFAFSGYILAENLFYPLFLAAFYFCYRSIKEDNWRWDVLAGVFLALSFLTRVIALTLVFAVLVISVYLFIRRKIRFGNKLLMALSFFIVISPWLVRNGLLYGFTFSGFLGSYSTSEAGVFGLSLPLLAIFAYWFLVYSVYLLIAGFALIPLLSLSVFREKKLLDYFLLSVLTVIFVKLAAVNHNIYIPWDLCSSEFCGLLYSKLMGRYVDVVLPIIFINGFVGLGMLRRNKIFKYLLLFSVPFFITSFVLLFYQLFPPNNVMLSWLGFLRYAFEFVVFRKSSFGTEFNLFTFVFFALFFVALPLLVVLFKKRFTFRNVALLYFILMLGISLVGYGMVYYNANRYWYANPQTQLGLWFNDYDKGRHSVVLFESRDEGVIQKFDGEGIYEDFRNGRSATVMGFWINDKIVIGDALKPVGADYVVSKHKLDLELINSIGDIYLYRVVG